MQDKHEETFSGSDKPEKENFDLNASEPELVQFYTNESGIKVMKNGEP